MNQGPRRRWASEPRRRRASEVETAMEGRGASEEARTESDWPSLGVERDE